MWSNEKKKVTINMKKYIKPKIDIIHAAPAQLMGLSKTELSTDTSVIHNSSTQGDTDYSMIGGDDDSGDGDLEAAKRWNDWGDQLWTGYSPW